MAPPPEPVSIYDWAITANLQPEPVSVSGDHVVSIDMHVLDHTVGNYRPFRTLTPEQEISVIDVPVRIQIDWNRLAHLVRG